MHCVACVRWKAIKIFTLTSGGGRTLSSCGAEEFKELLLVDLPVTACIDCFHQRLQHKIGYV